jgi:hypothetical protein
MEKYFPELYLAEAAWAIRLTKSLHGDRHG